MTSICYEHPILWISHLFAIAVLLSIKSNIIKLAIIYYVISDYFFHKNRINNEYLIIIHSLIICVIVMYAMYLTIKTINKSNSYYFILFWLIYLLINVTQWCIIKKYKCYVEIIVHVYQWLVLLYLIDKSK